MSSKIVDLRGKKPTQKPVSRVVPIRTSHSRVSPIRVRRRRTRLVITAGVFFFLTCVLAGVSYISYLPRYSIQAITVTGTQSVPPTLVSDYVEALIHDGSRHLISRANIFIYPSAVIEKDLAIDFPRIASAQLSRASLFSTNLVVNIVERQPFAFWCASQSDCYTMDKGGFIFAQTDISTTTGMYLFTGGVQNSSQPIGKLFAPGHVAGLTSFLDSLGQAGFASPGAQVQSDQDFSVPLVAGFPVYASFGEDSSTLVSNLKLVLSSGALTGKQGNIEYVDLRFGNRVYYKLKGEGEQQTATSTSR